MARSKQSPRESEHVDVLERGNIYFLYRPRVEEHDPEGSEDIQNLYLVLSPEGKKSHRLLAIHSPSAHSKT